MKKIIITITLSAFFALNIYSQYYSKIFLDIDPKSSEINLALPSSNDSVLLALNYGCDGVAFCANVGLVNKNVEYGALLNIQTEQFLANCIKYNKGNIFISSTSFTAPDGKTFWHYRVLDKAGNVLVSTKYLMPPGVFTFSDNVGIELVKNDEIILWGNVNVGGEKTAWLRIKKDGTFISGPNLFKPSDTQDKGRSTDAATNSNGNMVFIWTAFDLLPTQPFIGIYEINEIDQVDQIFKDDGRVSYPRMCATQDGNYIMSKIENNLPNALAKFYKISNIGDTIWSCPLPHLKSQYGGSVEEQDNIIGTTVRRIRAASNGDILFTGTYAYSDTIYNHIYDKKLLMTGGSVFFGRISAEGTLKWVNYIVSPKNETRNHQMIARDINEFPNGDILLGGSNDALSDEYYAHSWLLRVNDKGCFDDDCSHVDKWWYFPDEISVSTSDLLNYNQSLAIAPNPFQESITMMLPDDVVFPIYYQITTMAGQTVSQGTLDRNNIEFETSYLMAGTYIILCKDKSGKVYYKKGVKI